MDQTAARIRLVAGLGNPGADYARTRHNIGFMVVDRLAARVPSTWSESTKFDAALAKIDSALLVKPLAFMNRSGWPLHAVAQFYKIPPQQILVVLDDLALPVGRLRFRERGGPGGHNGLESVIVQFGTEEIPRLRIGIGAAPAGASTDYVLGRFFEEELKIVDAAIDRAADAVKWAIDNGIVSAMNNFNSEHLRNDKEKN